MSYKTFLYTILYYFFRVFPVRRNKIFIQNFNGKGYGDNPKYIVEEILRRGLDFDLVWAVKTDINTHFHPEIRVIKYKSIRAIYEEVIAGIWIDNCRKQPYVRKRREQLYIQTWHGGPTFVLKKVEKDTEASLSQYYVDQAKRDSLMVDLFLSCERNKKELYKSTFWYNGIIFECGSPSDDLFFNQGIGIKEKVFKIFSIKKSAKIILYAPTFRNTFDPDVLDIDYNSILAYLREKTGEHWVFFVRLHPNISEKSGFITYNDSIINASNYDDVQELMFACDMLISDYSGVMIEFAMMKKPVFLYTKDYASYIQERGFYIDLFSLPFSIAMTNDELLDNINSFDNISYPKAVGAFFQRIGLLDDGKASEKVVDRMLAELEKKS